MEDEGEEGELGKDGHGDVLAVPATLPSAEGEMIMEKLKVDFNLKEFFELASWVIDEGDSESMEILKALKKMEGEAWGRDYVGRTWRIPACAEFHHGAWTLNGPLAAAALTDEAELSAAAALTDKVPNFIIAHGTLHGPLAAAALTDEAEFSATAALTDKAPQSFITRGASRWPLPAPTSTATPLDAEKSPGMSASHTLSTPLTATSIDNEDSSLPPRKVHAPAKQPSTTLLLAVPTMKYHHPPSANPLFGLNGAFHHRSPVGSPSPTTCVHPAATGAHSMPWDRVVKTQQHQLHCQSHCTELSRRHQRHRRPLEFRRTHCRSYILRWNTTAVGYFLGKKPYFHHLNEFVRSIWPDGLSTVASGIGRPLYPDAITHACTRLDFARVCIMLNVSSKLPKHVVIMMPNELGGESACKVDIEYEWLPPKCTGCASLGHSMKECPLSKQTKPAVAIYVRKPPPPTPAAPELKFSEQGQADLVPEEIHPETETDRVGEEMSEYGNDKSNDIVLFNAFDVLQETNDDADGSPKS
ncbi:hypothetical protein Sango_3095900 [Sesamum angolense]|uniref:DUF4283 domain-containing protein n=1 Tax=Sesamum angolense TaxID=2727404 RepID=A0AAE1T8Q2_9LAMI|nr:hypothetical protein Sango_3095900 [Sesamum angolense]